METHRELLVLIGTSTEIHLTKEKDPESHQLSSKIMQFLFYYHRVLWM